MSSSNFTQLIKQIAMDAVRASKPCDYEIGTVTGTSPLVVKKSNEIEIDEDFLHLAESVTDHEIDLEINNITQKYKVHNALKVGEKVLMIRKNGGQEFMIVDRVVS